MLGTATDKEGLGDEKEQETKALFSHWEEHRSFRAEETVPVIQTWWSVLEG